MDHPNIIKVYGSYESEKCYFIVTDLYQGGELFELVAGDDENEEELSEQEVAHLMQQLLVAINVCHTNGVMHRDIKPENIMLHQRKEGEPMKIFLIDFGTARTFKIGALEQDYAGTAYYVAPEVILGSYDEKCDIWSCGMIAHLLLTKELPFDLLNKKEKQMLNILRKKPKFVIDEDILGFVSNNGQDFLKKLLQADPKKRLSASEALKHPWFKSNGLNKSTKPSLQALKNIKKLSGNNKMRHAILHFIIANQVSLETRQKYEEVFLSMDVNKDGSLSKEEISKGLKKMREDEGLYTSEEELDAFMEKADQNSDGQISYQEFLSAVIETEELTSDAQLKQAFTMFDQDGDGNITAEELVSVLHFVDGMDLALAKTIISKYDINKDGRLQFEELKRLMKQDNVLTLSRIGT